jgi:preprotein translocase subunit Sec61beta
MELDPLTLAYIAIAASTIVWLAKQFIKVGKPIPDIYLTGGVYAVSFVIALLAAAPTLPAPPACPDLATCVPNLLTYIGELLIPLSAFVGFATLIYQALLKRVLDGLANKARRLLARG